MFGHQSDQEDQADYNQAIDTSVGAIVNNDVSQVQASPGFMPPSTDASAPYGAPANDQPDDQTSQVPAPATLDTNGLLDIKQQALTQLSPLVGHLEQTPEEKFRTTMMMIQASDNQSLVKEAYEAAQQINDEKTKAQALLDVINEINYFTQHGKS
jgi:hypothetical protein